MTRATCTLELEWTVFEPGDQVSPTSSRCPLEPGIYTVTEFFPPLLPYCQEGTVFVEGHKYGVSAEYLILKEQ